MLSPYNSNSNSFGMKVDISAAMEQKCDKDPFVTSLELSSVSSRASSNANSSISTHNMKIPWALKRSTVSRRFDSNCCWERSSSCSSQSMDSTESDYHSCNAYSPTPCCVGNLINSDTLVACYGASTGRKSNGEWANIRNTPILREAAASWYFEVKYGWGEVAGPFSSRYLAHFIASSKLEVVTRVWSEELSASVLNYKHRNVAIKGEINLC